MEANEKKTGGTLKKNPSVLTSGILKVLKYLFLIVIIVISIGPIVWAFLSSFKTYAEINASALSLPKQFNLKNYIDAFRYAVGARFAFFFIKSSTARCAASASISRPMRSR